MKRYVMLDRDGTVIVHIPYLHDPAGVQLAPGAAEGLRALQHAGLGLVLLTNQSGVGRGMFGLDEVHRCNQRVQELLGDIRLAGVYVCPHAPEDRCDCRKPRPGLALQAAQELGFQLEHSFMLGDSACDLGLGEAVGAHTILLGTPQVPDMKSACESILRCLTPN